MRFGVNGSVQRHTVHLSLVIADDSHLVLKGHILLNVPTHKFLHGLEVVLNLHQFRVLTGLYQENRELVHLVRIAETVADLCHFRVKVHWLKANAVAEIEALFDFICFDNFYHIRNRKAPRFVAGRMLQIEHSVDIFKALTFHFPLKYLVINRTVDGEGVLVFCREVQVHKGNAVCVTLQIDLIDFNFHSAFHTPFMDFVFGNTQLDTEVVIIVLAAWGRAVDDLISARK